MQPVTASKVEISHELLPEPVVDVFLLVSSFAVSLATRLQPTLSQRPFA